MTPANLADRYETLVTYRKFEETTNLAAVCRLPVVFLCEDNAHSISVRRQESTAGELARRAQALGLPGVLA
jgi:TPP-dependent pyruvate/acetoin dehydrogenase alpha subunit